MSYRVVCISRDVGAGGEDIGRAVASQLGFRYVDEQIVQRVAEQSGLDHARVAGAEERRGLIARLLDAVEQSAAGLPEPYIYAADVQLPGAPGEDVRELIREAVRQTADDGDVVIVAHAASHVLAGRTEALRVWVTGSPDACAERLVADLRGGRQARRRAGRGRAQGACRLPAPVPRRQAGAAQPVRRGAEHRCAERG